MTGTRDTPKRTNKRTSAPQAGTAGVPAPTEQIPEPQPGDYDEVIGDLEPDGYGAAFAAARPIPAGLRALVGPPPAGAPRANRGERPPDGAGRQHCLAGGDLRENVGHEDPCAAKGEPAMAHARVGDDVATKHPRFGRRDAMHQILLRYHGSPFI